MDVRAVEQLPPTQRVAAILVVTPAELVANKVMALERRRGTPKSGTDWRDLAVLLLSFPELKSAAGPVRDRLEAAAASSRDLNAWNELVGQEILPEDEDEAF